MSRRGEPKQKYPDRLVARIKGAAAAGFKHKLIARAAGVSEAVVSHYSSGETRGEIQPDPFPYERLRDWLHGAE